MNPTFDKNINKYIDESKIDLVSQAIAGSKSMDLFQPQLGVKTSAAINLLKTNIKFNGSVCGWNPTSSDSFTQRTLDTGICVVNNEYCFDDMIPFWTQHKMKLSHTPDLGFGEYFIDNALIEVSNAIERAIYWGDKDISNTDENTNKFDGLIKLAMADGATIKPTITGLDAYNAIKAVKNAIPQRAFDLGEVKILVSQPLYRDFLDILVEKNLYHHSNTNGQPNIWFPSTQIEVVPVNGLNSDTDNYIIATSMKNVYYGTDDEANYKEVKYHHSEDRGVDMLKIAFNLGINYAMSDLFVIAQL